jgi:hypothetical protein
MAGDTVKLSKAFDYRKGNGKMTSYPAGYDGPMQKEHAEAAAKAGAISGKPTETVKDLKVKD